LENAKLDIPKWKNSNKGFTFTMEAGKVNAIMGQSGCGKTSLLYAIQGRKGLRENGKIVFNDNSTTNSHWHPLTTWLSDLVGYVPQDDVMHSDLTVFETVYFSARSRRLKDDTETIRNDVKFVLEKLDMTKTWYTLTEKLSGGKSFDKIIE
jgi:ABC-type multidrug transport system ATPase subunit